MKGYKQQQKHKYWCFKEYRIDKMEQAMSHKIIAMYQEDEDFKRSQTTILLLRYYLTRLSNEFTSICCCSTHNL